MMKTKTFITDLLFVLFITFICIFFVNYISDELRDKKNIDKKFNSLDSFIKNQDKKNLDLFSDIDSLKRLKQKETFYYKSIDIKYDTIQKNINDMPVNAGTLYLFSISRQLTDSGIE